MGVVYKARDVKLDRDVAIKVMDPVLARDEAFLNRFRQEAKALARLQNPHIVAIYSLLETESDLCIVMEYVKGRTLADIIKNSGALPLRTLFSLFIQLLDGFEHAHAAGIVHRDVKPGNIMVTEKNQIKVTDFGLAKLYRSTTATVTSISGGTLYYAPPEQVEGLGSVDHRGDIYSIGMTLYEAATGIVPFENAGSDFATRERIVKGKIPSPRTIEPHIRPELERVIMKALARDPEDRFQSAEEMRKSLETIAVMGRQGTRHTFASKVRSSIPLAIVTALIIAAIFLYSFLFLRHSKLSVRSDPSGASIEIDGKSVGETPISIESLSPGNLQIRAVKTGYAKGETTLAIGRDEDISLSFRLIRMQEAPSLEPPLPVPSPQNRSELSNVAKEVKVETQTRLEKRDRQATAERRESSARVSKPHDATSQKEPPAVETRQPGPTPASVSQPVSLATLVIEPSASNASLYINGNAFGPIGRQFSGKFRPGSYSIKVVAGSQYWEKRIDLQPGANASYRLRFNRQVTLGVKAVDQNGAIIRARVSIDGTPTEAITPANIEVPFGHHVITVQKEGYVSPAAISRNFEEDAPNEAGVTFIFTTRQP
jgi:serine/threonine protein kinase